MEEIVPSAARTVRSLRNIGYELPQAIADLIDNSIEASATKVVVDLSFDAANSWIRVADNGDGMSGRELTEALRYGSERDYDPDDLGKFGFGLKTASTSQCRRVSVASRRRGSGTRLQARCLDLNHIERRNRWEIIVVESRARDRKLTETLARGSGTVVLWEQLDGILKYENPWGEWARRHFIATAEAIDEHLGMVFHRFLAGEVPGRRLTITVNGTTVEPWDPFCCDESKTEELASGEFDVSGDEGPGIVALRPFVLPPQHEFSSEAAWRRASGPEKWNRQQGFYVYRANRMIQSGGWSRMRTMDEHTKLARVALEFFPELDAAFGIDVAKARVVLPPDLRDQIEPLVTAATRRAQSRYRGENGRGSRSGGGRRGGRGGGRGSGRGSSGEARGARSKRRALEDAAANVGEKTALGKIVRELKQSSPEVANDLGW